MVRTRGKTTTKTIKKPSKPPKRTQQGAKGKGSVKIAVQGSENGNLPKGRPPQPDTSLLNVPVNEKVPVLKAKITKDNTNFYAVLQELDAEIDGDEAALASDKEDSKEDSKEAYPSDDDPSSDDSTNTNQIISKLKANLDLGIEKFIDSSDEETISPEVHEKMKAMVADYAERGMEIFSDEDSEEELASTLGTRRRVQGKQTPQRGRNRKKQKDDASPTRVTFPIETPELPRRDLERTFDTTAQDTPAADGLTDEQEIVFTKAHDVYPDRSPEEDESVIDLSDASTKDPTDNAQEDTAFSPEVSEKEVEDLHAAIADLEPPTSKLRSGKFTYAEAAKHIPRKDSRLSLTALRDPECSARYTFRMFPEDNKDIHVTLSNALRKADAIIKQIIGQEVSIASWDTNEHPKVYNSDDLPTGEGPKVATLLELQKIIGSKGLPRANRKKGNGGEPGDYTLWGNLHFVTSTPTTLAQPLREIGQNTEIIFENSLLKLNVQPSHMPCARCACVGYFQYSTRAMESGPIDDALAKLLNLPEEAVVRTSWRRIKMDEHKMYPYPADDEPPAPSALHIDVSQVHELLVSNELLRLFKKRSKVRILGRRFRFVPCRSSQHGNILKDMSVKMNQAPRTEAPLAEAPEHTIAALHQRQKFFCNDYTTTLECHSIVSLDHRCEDKLGNRYSLREYLMSLTPPDSVTARVFVSIDKKYNQDYYLFTCVESYKTQALKIQSEMIPQTLFVFGPSARRWWTEEALRAYAHCKWDAKKGLSMGNTGADLLDHSDDPFNMMEAFQAVSSTAHYQIPSKEASPQAQDSTSNPVASPAMETVGDILKQRSRLEDDQSVGLFLDREHDGDTVKTVHQQDEERATRTSTVGFSNIPDEIPAVATPTVDHDEDMSVSTMASSKAGGSIGSAATTQSTRLNLRQEKQTSALLRKENLELLRQRDEELEEAARRADLEREEWRRERAESKRVRAEADRRYALLQEEHTRFLARLEASKAYFAAECARRGSDPPIDPSTFPGLEYYYAKERARPTPEPATDPDKSPDPMPHPTVSPGSTPAPAGVTPGDAGRTG